MAQDQLRRLQSLKNRLDNAKMEESRLRGRLETFYFTLNECKVKTVTQAEKKVNDLKKKEKEIGGAIEETLDVLENEFDIWEKVENE